MKCLFLGRFFLPLFGWLAAAVFVFSAFQLKHAQRPSVLQEMQTVLPRVVQVVMAVGDRYLAANIAGFRALVASTETMTRDNYYIQARVQSDAAWLNPFHEDNYYIAAAILPWNDEVDAAQYVLKHAARVRVFDWQPAFYFAFNELTFHKSPIVAAEWLMRASDSAGDEMQKIQLQQLAAQWAAKSDDPSLAIRLHRAMARETRYKAFSAFLEKRAQRLENLMRIEAGVATYRQHSGRAPVAVDELIAAGVLDFIPLDPFEEAYVISADGKVATKPKPAKPH